MAITKEIICISCGKSFLVDREEYEKRLEESLCDKCREAIAVAENSNDVDTFLQVSEAVTRIARNIGGKMGAMLQDGANNQHIQNNDLSEEDSNE